ncbi:MAG: molecular chaperone DnaJ [Henriciella sp.]|uniref:J domain-containing protein n=1 Tax=Henriciella sp. TaxID=1968823 RepID=UPI000C0CD8BA|nr:J domain-containing protein [Henriciella sp.]MAN73956.1 molecular chaperone DnaJ [Henriciella sp.]MBF34300.1 molecular chaperone DnaJ [Hyphomonadaceae bacterium]PHR77667.1 MAG: molecular chaperone DnaJ [Henriciella sp.]
MARDPYQTLGVSKSATTDEIRKAYRKKAKELHPDLHPNDEEKANAFKEASAAFEILSDEEKRAQFDRGEIDADGNPTGFANAGGGFGGGFGGGGFRQQGGSFQGDPFEDILSGMFGGQRRRPGPRKGADIRYRVDISFEDSVQGAKRQMTMADNKSLNVSIPPGVTTGQVLRLKSQGQPSQTGGPPGDALLELHVRPSKTWTRDGADLRMSVPLPLKTALLGGTVEVATPGGPVTLKVPEGSNTGSVLRLRNKGVQFKDKPGHLYVRLEITLEDPKDEDLIEWAKSH